MLHVCIGEVLYNGFGEYSEDKTKVKFVNTWYNANALGKEATFILFDISICFSLKSKLQYFSCK